MPQMHFPIFPSGVRSITSSISFKKEDGKIVYFDWQMPIFTHDEDDIKTFRMFTSQLCVNGNAKQVDIIRAFGVTKNSVLRSVKLFRDKGPEGFYSLESIFLLMAFLALGRVKTIESLRAQAPGEWGKLLGLDRIPEVKTLREKINILSAGDTATAWMSDLSSDWMNSEPESAGVLLVDGHVRVYNGNQTKLPRQYVARNKLCLRATIDYWVNALDGQPFFKVTKEVNSGLIKVLKNEIVPQLEEMVPHQPTEIELLADIYLHRFLIVFDREGYSPDFFLKMKEKRIACVTYHKHPGEDWPEAEFRLQKVKLNGIQTVEMNLAERGSKLSNGLWVREVRKLSQNHHQTSVISTDYISDLRSISVAMFSRWSQENYFRYMRQEYNLDALIDYKVESIDGTIQIVNPQYRKIDGQVRSKVGILNRRMIEFAATSFKKEINPKKIEKYQQKKAELKEEIEELQVEVKILKKERKETRRHITISELPEDDRFKRLNTKSKYFIDTIKMIAYRAETAMSNILREKMSQTKEARSLLRALYTNEANLIPNEKEGTLTVELHHFVNRKDDISITHLCDELNATKTIFPGTNMKLIYKLVS